MHYEGDYTGAYTDVYSRMYPNLVETAAIGGETGADLLGCGPADAQRVRSKPFLLCEYAHAMGNGPGALTEYDELAERYPPAARRLHLGVARPRAADPDARTARRTTRYGGDFGEVVHDGNFVMDGMVLPDDTPTPGLAEFAAVNAPVVFELDDGDADHHATGSTRRPPPICGSSRCVEVDGEPAAEADARRAGDRGRASRPRSSCPTRCCQAAGRGETWLTVRAELAADQPWAPAGHVVARRQFAARPRHARAAAGTRRRDSAPSDPWPTATRSRWERPIRRCDRRAARAARAAGRRTAAGAVAGADRQRPRRPARIVRAGRAGGHRRRGGARPVLGAALARARPGPAGHADRSR